MKHSKKNRLMVVFLIVAFRPSALPAAEATTSERVLEERQIGGSYNFLVDVHAQASVGQLAGDTIEQTLTIGSAFGQPCLGGVVLTAGAGQDPTGTILTDGVALGNFQTFELPPWGTRTFTFSAPAGSPNQTFAIWVEADPLCAPYLFTQTSFTVTGNSTEVFSSPSQPLIYPGTCGKVAAAFDPGVFDSGIATIGVPFFRPLDASAEICRQLFDTNGAPASERSCTPYDGTQMPELISQAFPISGAFTGTVELCLNSENPEDRVAATSIGVNTIGGQVQLSSASLEGTNIACTPDENTVCTGPGARFRISTGNTTSPPVGVPLRDWTAIFGDPAAGEALVKVLDGCSINNHFGVFAAATTSLEYDLVVTDTRTGATKEYSGLQTPSPAITDTQAFATCP